jgi:hypothetical protein
MKVPKAEENFYFSLARTVFCYYTGSIRSSSSSECEQEFHKKQRASATSQLPANEKQAGSLKTRNLLQFHFSQRCSHHNNTPVRSVS